MTSGDESEDGIVVGELDCSSLALDAVTLQERWQAVGALLQRVDEGFFQVELAKAERTALYLCGNTDDSEDEPV